LAIMTKMIAKATVEGQTIPATIDWAAKQLEAFAVM